MGVTETVAALAGSIAQVKALTNPRHRLLVEILRLMPLYSDVGDLTAWESAFQGVLEDQDDESEIGNLLWDIFVFGRMNMYVGFDARQTEIAFRYIAQEFERRGVPVTPQGSLDDW